MPHNKEIFRNVHSIPEATIVGDMERIMPRISATLENWQANHQTWMVKIKGMIKHQPISIIIYPGEILCYVSPRIVE